MEEKTQRKKEKELFKPVKDTIPVYYVPMLIDIGIGPSAYKGDLISRYSYWTSCFHTGIKFNKAKRINHRIGFMIGSVAGQNLNYIYTDTIPIVPDRKYFKTTLFQMTYEVQINLIKSKKVSLYLSQGLGLLKYTPKDENENILKNDKNSRAKNENYNNISVTLPTKAGFIYNLNNYLGLGLEAGYLHPMTDYMDNISKLSKYSKMDNVLFYKFSLYIPLK